MKPQFQCPWCGWATKQAVTDHCTRCGQRVGENPDANLPGASGPQTSQREALAEKTIVLDHGQANVISSRLAVPGTEIPDRIGPYEILKVLGRGGMGSVYLAYDPLLNREVALKLLTHSDPTKTAEESARLLSEAMLTGRLDSAGIIPIYAVDYDPEHGYFYTMRYLQGRNLQDILNELKSGVEETREAFPQRRLLTIFQRACEAVAFAHKNRVIHRDLKPGNIMITDFGEVYVVDWGLAKDIDPSYVASATLRQPESADRYAHITRTHLNVTRDFLAREKSVSRRLQGAHRPMESAAYPEHLTDAHQIVGTPAYLSPEQVMRDVELAPQSDVYALGVILYELLTRQHPIDAVEMFDMFQKLTSGEIVPIHKRPESYRVPKALCDIVHRALVLKQADRFPDAGELHRELTEYLEGRPPLKPVWADEFIHEKLSAAWRTDDPQGVSTGAGVLLKDGRTLTCAHSALGDFRVNLQVQALSRAHTWSYGIRIGEFTAGDRFQSRYEIRLGIAGRASIELYRDGQRVQRRLDIRMQRARYVRLRIEMNGDTLRVFVDDRKYLDYRELFPQTGGAVQIAALSGEVHLRDFDFTSRGAPLNLSSLSLPDQLFRAGLFRESKDLYLKLAASHPDREEGLSASYKAGLCSVELGDLQNAFAEFARLEDTVFDHYCALGLARIGSVDGNIDWAWEALKQGYRRHRAHEIGSDMWFALLELVGSVGAGKKEEKLARYHELLRDLEPSDQEAGQLAVDLLDAAAEAGGLPRLRQEAVKLLAANGERRQLKAECIQMLWRTGLTEAVMPMVEAGLECSALPSLRVQLLRAEISVARGDVAAAARVLAEAAEAPGDASSEQDWIRDWGLFLDHLQGQHRHLLMATDLIIKHSSGTTVLLLSYPRLLRALAYSAQGEYDRARSELRGAAPVTDLWGLTARSLIAKLGAAAFMKSAANFNAVQAIEALFLMAEWYRLTGENVSAREYLEACKAHSTERAMIRNLAISRLEELSVRP